MKTTTIRQFPTSIGPTLSAMVVLIALLVIGAPQVRASDELPRQADGQLLNERALDFWQRLNEARANPLATAARLGISEETLRIVFADRPWIVDSGLPPLAWNGQLRTASAAHGRDMFDRSYYGHHTPEGWYYDGRVAAAGYPATYVGGSIGGLFFSNYISLDEAIGYLLDSMLYDELSGNTAVQRNIFSADLTEVGIAFFAETGNPTGDKRNPYAYVVVATFAAPLEPRAWLIGSFDAAGRPAIKHLSEGLWRYVPTDAYIAPGLFQVAWPRGGAQLLVAADGGLGPHSEPVTLYDDFSGGNRLIDLRPAPPPPDAEIW